MTILDAVSFFGGLVIFVFIVTGAIPWLRCGYEGFEFVRSVDFTRAVRTWKIQLEKEADLERERQGTDLQRASG